MVVANALDELSLGWECMKWCWNCSIYNVLEENVKAKSEMTTYGQIFVYLSHLNAEKF